MSNKQVSKLRESGGSHHRYHRWTTHTSGSHESKTLHEYASQEEFQINKKGKEKLIIRESHYEVEVDLQYKEKEGKHFSHRHPLHRHKLEEEANIICEVCELELVGPAYGCAKCEFFMHESCYGLPIKIQHRAHRDHPLSLRPTSAYGKDSFRCNGCWEIGNNFNYHCSTCHYDLHVSCAGMPKVVYPKILAYSLDLFYRFPKDREAERVYCFVCDNRISKNGWLYYNKKANIMCHLGCAFGEQYSEMDDLDDAILAITDRLEHLETK